MIGCSGGTTNSRRDGHNCTVDGSFVSIPTGALIVVLFCSVSRLIWYDLLGVPLKSSIIVHVDTITPHSETSMTIVCKDLVFSCIF